MRASSSGLTPGRAPVRVNGSGVIMKVPALEYVIVFVTAVCAAGCGSASSGSAPPVIQPGAPGQQDKVLTADTASALPQPKFSPADVTFMQGMIHHHSQAIDMVELLYQRTARRCRGRTRTTCRAPR